jgi:hypothetical protein
MTETSVSNDLLSKVDLLLSEVTASEALLDVNWIRLGTLLESIQVNKDWKEKFKSFGAYLKEVVEKHTIKRSQLYNYIAVARTLRPILTVEQLTQIGISKARALTDGFKALGGMLPKEAIETALDASKTAENVKEAIFKGSNVEEKGDWYSLSGFVVSKDERATLDLFFETAKRTDPVIPNSWKSWQVLKECLLRASMEYISSHPEVQTFQEEVSF